MSIFDPHKIILCVTFLGSSVAEQSAVNRSVVGSNPTRGATNMKNRYATIV